MHIHFDLHILGAKVQQQQPKKKTTASLIKGKKFFYIYPTRLMNVDERHKAIN